MRGRCPPRHEFGDVTIQICIAIMRRHWLLLHATLAASSPDCPSPPPATGLVPSVTIGLYPGIDSSWSDDILSSLLKVGSPADDVKHTHWPHQSNQVEQYLAEAAVYRSLRRSPHFEPEPTKADFLYVPILATVLRSWKDCGCMPTYRFNKVDRKGKSDSELNDPNMRAYCPKLLWQCPEHTSQTNLPWEPSLMTLLDDITSSELWQKTNGSHFIWTLGRADIFTDRRPKVQRLAVAYNIVIFQSLKTLSSVGTVVLGNVKIVLLIALTAMLLGELQSWTTVQIVGCVATFGGSALYSFLRWQARQQPAPAAK